jgi:dipeptidyl aminopeptidase/acylaminoacyl peptidase
MNRAASLVALSLLGLALIACGAEPPPPAPPPAPPPVASSAPAAVAPAPPPPPRADASLTPRKVFFDNPDRARVEISPDGKRLGWLAPLDGVLNLFVAPADDPSKAQPVTHEKTRPLRRWWWAFTSDHVIYAQDKDGDENWHVYAVDLKKNEAKDLTPIDGVNAELTQISAQRPNEILVGLNDRDKKVHDVHLVDLRTGARKLVAQNDGGFAGWVTDDALRVRFAARTNGDGSMDLLQPDPKEKWKTFQHAPLEDALSVDPVDFDRSGATLYLKDSRGRDTAGLFAVDTKTGKAALIADDPHADAGDVLLHPTRKTVEAVLFEYEKPEWRVVDKSVEPDLAYLRTVAEGTIQVTSRSLDEKRWLVAFAPSDGPLRFYLYDRGAPGKAGKAAFLFTNEKALEGVKLAKMEAHVIKSRDGLDLVSYLSLPPGGAGRSLPMVLFVHGGPWGRDRWGFSATHQWLASRGYAVLSVNYRGSTGFGKKFVNAGNLEWAGKMHDDLVDAVHWAVDQGIADPSKVAIMGGSYGGYATLVGLTFTPDQFACGVDIVGPSNLMTLLQTIPPYWQPEIEQFAKRVGDWRTDDGKKLLAERSPLTRAGAIKRPLLIGQGANDPRVKQAESDQIVTAMKGKGIPVTYVLYSDEGHGFARPANRTSFNAVAEVFLAQCLGGPYQPVGDDFAGSTIAVPAGAENVYGLADALAAKGAKSAPSAPAPSAPVPGAAVTLPNGGSGWLVQPAGAGKHPAVLVIQEWWGVTDWLKQQAARLASKGYVALAVDLYRGKATSDPGEAHELMRGLPEDRAMGDMKAGFDWLAARADVDPARIGIVGWCMGGGYALAFAVAEPRLRAAAINYGRLVSAPEKVDAIRAAVLGNFAGADRGIAPDDVRAFADRLKAGHKDSDVKIYDGAKHAFMNPGAKDAYDAAAATDAWARIDGFFARTLKP